MYTRENSEYLLELAKRKTPLTDSEANGLTERQFSAFLKMQAAFNGQYDQLNETQKEAAALCLANNTDVPPPSVADIINIVTQPGHLHP